MVTVPASVTAFLQGSPTPDGKWTVPVPTGGDVDTYEATMAKVIQGFPARVAAITVPVGSPVPSDISDSMNDIDTYIDYLRTKTPLVTDPAILANTPTPMDYWKTQFPGGWSTFMAAENKVMNIAQGHDEQVNLAINHMDASLIQTFNAAQQSFVRDKVIPLSVKFGASDAMFIQQVFIYNMDGDTSLADLVRALKLISPFLTKADVAPVFVFAPYMVFGLHGASPYLHSDIMTNPTPVSVAGVMVTPYPQADFAAQAQDLTQKRAVLAGKLAPYLDSAVGPYWDKVIAHTAAGDVITDGSDSQVMYYVNKALTDGVNDGISGAQPSTTTNSSALNAIAQNVVQNVTAVSPEAAAQLSRIVNLSHSVPALLSNVAASLSLIEPGQIVIPELAGAAATLLTNLGKAAVTSVNGTADHPAPTGGSSLNAMPAILMAGAAILFLAGRKR